MAELTTTEVIALHMSREELAALRAGLKAALATKDGTPAEREHWKAMARVGQGPTRTTEDPRARLGWGQTTPTPSTPRSTTPTPTTPSTDRPPAT